MSERFVYRAEHPHGPNVIDRKTGHFMGMELAAEYAAVVNAVVPPSARDLFMQLDAEACSTLRDMLGAADEPDDIILRLCTSRAEDGSEVYGLHVQSATYPEEGTFIVHEIKLPEGVKS